MPDSTPPVSVCIVSVEEQPNGPLITVTVEDDQHVPGCPFRRSFAVPSQALAAVAEFLGAAVPVQRE